MGELWTRLSRVFTHSSKDLDDADLRTETERLGATRIADLTDRVLVSLSGVVTSLTIPPQGQAPALVADLYDGSGTVCLVWVGRRMIRGIEPGVRMRVSGRVSRRRGVPTIYNPVYELLARDVIDD